MGEVLVINAGSTGVKLRMVDGAEAARPLDSLDEAPGDLLAVGHRVVHGGERFTTPAPVDDALVRGIEELESLAPLHNAPALRLARQALARFPGVPQVAAFDTAFHATLPEEAAVYAVPRSWRRRGVRRYGFHGLSVAWSLERATDLLGARPERLVVCHLGGGASVTAVRDGRSVDTSMGFSPLEGLVMATRSGSVDPQIPLHMVLHEGVAAPEAERGLTAEGGLLALAGTADMREVEAAAACGDADARLALAVHDHRLASCVAAMAASLGGVDAIVFTGGVGEGSARVRAEAARRLGFLGVGVDARRNAAAGPDADVSAEGSPVRTLVVRAREEVVIARAVRGVLADTSSGKGAR